MVFSGVWLILFIDTTLEKIDFSLSINYQLQIASWIGVFVLNFVVLFYLERRNMKLGGYGGGADVGGIGR